jgi:outer membrane protein insertion porin family
MQQRHARARTCAGTPLARPHAVRCLALAVLLAGCVHAHAHGHEPACSGTLPLAELPARVDTPLTPREGVIESVSVTGAPDVEPIVRSMLESAPGGELAEAPIAADVRRLWALGLFSEVRVDAHPRDAHRIALEFAVTPHARIDRVRVEGAGAHDPELRRMHWLAGLPFEPRRLVRMARAIELAYLRDGHLDAAVAVRRARQPGVELCVATEPGSRVTIARVTFPGRHAVSEAELFASMRGKYGDHAAYDPEALEDDRTRMLMPYWERGYMNAHVEPPRVARRGDRVAIELPIAEGPVFYVGTVRVDGGLPAPPELRRGDVFVRSRVIAAIEALQARLGDAVVTPQTTIDGDNRRIDLMLHIQWSWPWSASRWLLSR